MCKGCHIVVVKVRVKSIAALKAAVARMGGVFHENAKEYRWYGEYKRSEGNKPVWSHYSPCDHVIAFTGINYTAGVIKEGNEYIIKYDPFDERLADKIGYDNANKLMQLYCIEAAKEQALMQCNSFLETTLEDGSIQLRVQVQE